MQTFEKEINPVYTRLDEIKDFTKVVPQTNTEKDEYPHLQKVTDINVSVAKKMIQKLHDLEIELEDQAQIIQMETDIDAKKDAVGAYNKILQSIRDTVERINRELIKVDTPYFGKILFSTHISGSERLLPIYIGKFALMDPKTYQPLISDWRAPIANIYYENSGPTKNLQYESPAGIREGDIVSIENASTIKEYSEIFSEIKPNQTITIEKDNEIITVVTAKNQINESIGYIGIGITPKLSGIAKIVPYIPSKLIFWIFITNFFVGLFNLLPLPIVDGGRMAYIAALHFTKSEKKAKKIAKRAYSFSVFLFLLLFLVWIVRMF